MITGRIFLGIFAGSCFVVAPLYVGEIAEKQIRGTLGTFTQLMVSIGQCFSYIIGATVNAFWLSTICMILPVLCALLFTTMPETPTYYISKNKTTEAENSLRWLRGADFDISSEIETLNVEKEERKKLNANRSLKVAFSRIESRLALLIVIGLMIIQQTCGINAVIFYTTRIFGAANTGIPKELQTITIGAIQIVMTIVAGTLVDRLGRKILLLVSGTVVALSMIALGLYFHWMDQDPENQNLGWLPITSLSLFMIFYSIGFGPLPFLILGEICAPDIKGVAVGLALTVNWILSFLITKFFDNMITGFGIAGTFWIFSGFSMVGTVFILVVLPETKGISLEEIQRNLRKFKLFSF
jgi:sugar porter (SP) family MFS transporter